MPASLKTSAMNSACATDDAEAERPHRAGVGDLVRAAARSDDRRAGVVAGVDVARARRRRSGRASTGRRAGRCRRRRRSSGTGTSRSAPSASHSRSSAAVRPSKKRPDVDAVGALGGRGQPEQLARLRGGRAGAGRSAASAWWNSSTTTTSKCVGGEPVDAVRRQRLHAGEDVRPPLRPVAADVAARRSSRRPAPRGRCAATARGSPRGGRRTAATGRAPCSLAAAAGSPARRRPSCRCRSPRRRGCGAGRGPRAPTSSASSISLLVRVRADLEAGQGDRHAVVRGASRRLARARRRGGRRRGPGRRARRSGRPSRCRRSPANLSQQRRAWRPPTAGRSTPRPSSSAARERLDEPT